MRVSPQGVVLDPTPLLVYEPALAGGFSLTSDGTNWCIVTQTTASNGVVARRIGPNGTFLDPTPVTLLPPSDTFASTAVSARGEYLVTFRDVNGNLLAGRFNSALAPIAPPFPVPGTQIASNGSDYYVIFNDGISTTVGSRLTYTGTLLDGAGVPITNISAFESDLAWSGTYWWYAWVDGFNAVSATRITPANVVLDFNGVPYDVGQKDQLEHLHIAGAPSGGLQIAFHDHRLNALDDHDASAGQYSVSGQPLPQVAVSSGAPSQVAVDTAYGDGKFASTYASRRSGLVRILAQRLDFRGQPIGTEPVEVATGRDLDWPRIAWNGSLYLIVWSDWPTVFARRYSALLEPIDAAPIRVMTGFSPDVGPLGSAFLIAAVYSAPMFPQFRAVYSRRLDGASGNVLDASSQPLGGNYASVPRVEHFGNRWFVVYQNNASHDNPQGDVSGNWVDASGKPSALFTVIPNGFQPDIAVSGRVALIVARRNSAANANNDLQAVRMLIDGTFPAPAFTVSDAVGRQTTPGVAWDGANFITAWEDQRNQQGFFDPRTDIYAMRIDEAGQLLDPGGFVIANSAAPEVLPSLVSGGGTTLIATPTFHPEAPLSAYRVDLYRTPGTATNPPSTRFVGEPTQGCAPLQV